MILHTCWLVDPWKPSREKYLRAWRELGWRVAVWTMEPIEHLPTLGVDHRPALEVVEGSPIERAFLHAVEHKDHATAADLFRYQVLLEHGGAYADLDVEPLDRVRVDRIGDRVLPGFALDMRSKLEIRFIVTPGPGHPLIENLRNTAAANADAFIAAGGWSQARAPIREVLERTGPKMARKVVERFAHDRCIRQIDFLIAGAVNERTPENNESHFVHKAETIRRIAAQRAGLPDPPGSA